MRSSGKSYDDLTVIKGIGEARQQWLRESFNVRTFQDLAALSADEIESQIKADGKLLSRKVIEDWLAQARELAANNPTNSPVAEDGWKPFASFVVEFQTRDVEGPPGQHRTAVHYMEKDTGANWPGIESTKLCQWMKDQIRGEVGLESEEQEASEIQPTPPGPVEKPPAKITIRQLQIFQPPQAKAPVQTIEAGKPFQGSVTGNEPFTIDMDFELTGPAADDIASKQTKCHARSYAYDQTQKTSIDLSDTGPKTFEEGELAYTFSLPEATLQPGSYRLFVLVVPEAGLAIPDYLEVPAFQVV